MDGADPLGVEHLLLAGHHIFQEIDGDVVVRRQVHPDVGGEEVVDLALAAVFGRELLGGYLGIRRRARIDSNILTVDWSHRHVILVLHGEI